MRWIVVLILLTTQVWAQHLSWSQIETDMPLILKQEINFQKSPEVIYKVPKNLNYSLKESYSLPGLSVVFFEFITDKCPTEIANQYAEMTILEPEGSGQDRNHSVGVALDFNCTLEIFVETLDLNSISLFHGDEHN
jgi:hypothetical protein